MANFGHQMIKSQEQQHFRQINIVHSSTKPASVRVKLKKIVMDQLLQVKCHRDVECLKMKEASNVLQHLNNNSRYGFWYERLLAEKVLLESGHTVDLLAKKIREGYCSTSETKTQIGTVSVENFQFQSTRQYTKSNETEFYTLLLSNGTDVKTSKIARATNGYISFSETFSFEVTPNFKILVQLYGIWMKEPPKLSTLGKYLQCKNSSSCIFSKLQYQNPNTRDIEESTVLKSSFRLLASTEICSSDLQNTKWKLASTPDSDVNDWACFSVKMDNFTIGVRRSGFLTLGIKHNDTFVWNRQWCVLDGSNLKIYNSPSEEDLVDGYLKVDLINCPSSEITEAPRTLCNRPRSLMVHINEDGGAVTKYFFMADNSDDLKSWMADLNLVLDLLRNRNTFKPAAPHKIL
ncbi:hypothetical protein MTP99_002558 [Tenebrio molitor]|nr:hypothetical protein MTP99_002558 [Tenebrio molitor]